MVSDKSGTPPTSRSSQFAMTGGKSGALALVTTGEEFGYAGKWPE